MKTGPEIDPFRRRQVPDVAGRFERERKRCQREADLAWLGAMVAFFSDHELRLMRDLGFMSQHDLDLLRQAGRPVKEGRTMTDEEVLASIDRHFRVGCPSLSTTQLAEHQATGSCDGCCDASEPVAAVASLAGAQ